MNYRFWVCYFRNRKLWIGKTRRREKKCHSMNEELVIEDVEMGVFFFVKPCPSMQNEREMSNYKRKFDDPVTHVNSIVHR